MHPHRTIGSKNKQNQYPRAGTTVKTGESETILAIIPKLLWLVRIRYSQRLKTLISITARKNPFRFDFTRLLCPRRKESRTITCSGYNAFSFRSTTLESVLMNHFMLAEEKPLAALYSSASDTKVVMASGFRKVCVSRKSAPPEPIRICIPTR